MILITEERYNRLLNGNSSSVPKPLESTSVKPDRKKQVKRKTPPPPGIPESKKAKRVLNIKRF